MEFCDGLLVKEKRNQDILFLGITCKGGESFLVLLLPVAINRLLWRCCVPNELTVSLEGGRLFISLPGITPSWHPSACVLCLECTHSRLNQDEDKTSPHFLILFFSEIKE